MYHYHDARDDTKSPLLASAGYQMSFRVEFMEGVFLVTAL